MSTELAGKAKEIRRWILKSITEAKSGHPGGSLSIADIMAALYFKVMRVDPHNPAWPDRDRFVLCKGHAAPALYATLAVRGFFPTEEMLTLRKIDSRLQGHPDMKKVPGVDMSTGSLGQGLSTCVGMALAARLDKKDYKVYGILGDGEVQEGQVWEAAMAAGHYKLDNLIVFLDNNGLQIDGPVQNVLSPLPLVEKWQAFNWNVIEIDGHNYEQILDAIEQAQRCTDKPTLINAKTIKGKGVSFMEDLPEWHGTAPSKEQLEQALKELAD